MKLSTAQYIEKIGDDAVKATKGTPLFPSVLIAQAIIESGNGNSSLAREPNNNHFGIKAGSSWKGAKVELLTSEFLNGKWVKIKEPFRVYPNTVASLKDRNKLFNYSRYKKVLTAQTPEEQATEIHKAGYATAPSYSASLIKMINDSRYNLKRFDEKKSEKTCECCGQLLLS